MNKGELISQVAENAGLSKAQAEAAVAAVLDGITGALQAGDSAAFIGFGTFSVSHRAERQGRNPQTGATITIAAKNLVKFKAGKKFVDSLN